MNSLSPEFLAFFGAFLLAYALNRFVWLLQNKKGT
jgi:predicted PurR-regulated permease PerM